jgi:hypothetical protein
MSKFDWNAWAAADYEQPGRIRQLIADLREASALLSKLDPPLKPEQQQLQLEAPDPTNVAQVQVPASPAAEASAQGSPTIVQSAPVRSGVLDEGHEPSAAQKDRNKCRWTKAERACAETLIDRGTSKRRVAEIMGRTTKGIEAALTSGVIKPKSYRPHATRQAAGRLGALSRGYVLRNGAELPH